VVPTTTARTRRNTKAVASSPTGADIQDYTAKQASELAAVCDALRAEIDKALPGAESKVWHGAPVWFLEGYPVAGYSIKAKKVSLLFWNGQNLDEPMLRPTGKHFAAEMMFVNASEIDRRAIRRCLVKAGKNVFKDYASLRQGGSATESR
jgi:hypothetical protein